jgi:hypothetical protein
MTAYRQLPLSRLGHLIPPLVDGQALVGVLVTTEDLPWAAKAAWDIARIAVREGRRVALIDLHLEHPMLHEIVGLKPREGIVDAFEYGVSLNKAAHEITGVFFIPVGTDTTRAGELYAHTRWRRLQDGFRAEGALMLVLLSEAGLAQLSAPPDGLIILAPEGLGETFVNQRDIPVLGVVRDRWLPSNGHPRVSSAPVPMPVATPVHPARHRRVRAAFAALFIAALAVGGWALLAGARESSFTAPPPAPASPAPIAPSISAPTATKAPARPRPDTLGWTIQLAAYGTLDKALAHADRLAADAGIFALVTPVPQGGSKGRVWYRVQAGSYRTRVAAADARATMWHRGIVGEGIGDLLLAPYSYRIPSEGGGGGSASLDALRRRGVPAVRWSDGNILVGAFEAADEATYTQTVLTRARVRASLLPRMGIRTP